MRRFVETRAGKSEEGGVGQYGDRGMAVTTAMVHDCVAAHALDAQSMAVTTAKSNM